MISWSNNKLRFTSGIGGLCMAGLLSELFDKKLPVWLALTIALLPLIIFLFFQAGEVRSSIVRPLQTFAAFWYLVSALCVSVLFLLSGKCTPPWLLMFLGLAVGAVPCVVVLKNVLWADDAEPKSIISGSNPEDSREALPGARQPPPGEMSREFPASGELLLKPAIWKEILLLGGALLLSAGGLLMIKSGKWAGWLVFALFGLGALLPLLTMLPGSCGLKLTPEGFTVTHFFRQRSVHWQDVEGFGVISIATSYADHKMVGFNYAPESGARGSAASRTMTGYEDSLPDTFGMKPGELAMLMEQWRLRFSPQP